MRAIGFRTLLGKETRRFLKVPGQTLAAPIITTLLYFLVFGFALGGRLREVHGVPYMRFLVPGLVMLPLLTNAFLNSSSSLFGSKIQGTIVDLLVAPLSYAEILGAFTVAATLRGLACGAAVYLVAGAFTTYRLAEPWWAISFALLTAVTFALLGFIVGVVSEKFEHINIFPTFIVTPLTFLGGVFYSVDLLPEPWRTVSHLNPILYLVEGLRRGFLGSSDVDPRIGIALVAGIAAAAWAVAYGLLRSGYKLRS